MPGPVRHRYNLRSRQARPSDSLSQRPVRHRYNLRSNAAQASLAAENNRVPVQQTPTSQSVPAMQTPSSENASAMQASRATVTQRPRAPAMQTRRLPGPQAHITTQGASAMQAQSLSVPDVRVESSASQIASGEDHQTHSSLSASAMQVQGVPAMQTPLGNDVVDRPSHLYGAYSAVVRPAPVEREHEDEVERPLQRRQLSQGDNNRSGVAPLSGPSEVGQQNQQQQTPQQPTNLAARPRAARTGRPTARRGGGGRRGGVARRGGRGREEVNGQNFVWRHIGSGHFRRFAEGELQEQDRLAQERRQQQQRQQQRRERQEQQQQLRQQEHVYVDQAMECPICVEPFNGEEDEHLLPCGHKYHQVCIEQWLQSRNLCPNCRQPVLQ